MTIIFSDSGCIDLQPVKEVLKDMKDVKVMTLTREMELKMGVREFNAMVDKVIAEEDDMLVLCGHGGHTGLSSPSFRSRVFGRRNMGLVRAQKVLCIWCKAAEFCQRNNFSALASSLNITNSSQAAEQGFAFVSQNEISETNKEILMDVNTLINEGVPFLEWSRILKDKANRFDPIDVFNRGGIAYFEQA